MRSALVLPLAASFVLAACGETPVYKKQEAGVEHCGASHGGAADAHYNGDDGVRDNGGDVVVKCADGAVVRIP